MDGQQHEGGEPKPRDELAQLFSAAHPVRAIAFAMMDENPASPKEIAAAVGKPIGNVAYHVRELLRSGLIELVETRKVRGGTEHFYRARVGVTITDDESAKLSLAERRMQSTMHLQMIIGDAARASDANVLDRRPDRHISRMPLIVDERGWEALRDLLNATLERALELEAECRKRLKEDGEEGFPALAALMLFELPDSP